MPSTNGHGSKPGQVALYLRVSSEEQRDRETIELQEEFLEQYCRLYDLEVADIYEDDGVSGTIPLHERSEGRRLLEDAREGKFQSVLVKKLDRLGRSLLVIVDAHDRLAEAGVALKSTTEPIDTSTPSGRLIFQMLASFAEYDRESIRERTQAGLHRAWRNGVHMGAIPYGYDIAEGGAFVVVPEEAHIVREIIANIAEGSTLYREAKRLNDLGLPSPGSRFKGRPRKHGRSWLHTTIRGLVHQRAYSGVHRVKLNGGEGFAEREVPAIVPPPLQERALTALTENKRYAGGKKGRNYLLRGRVWCVRCGTTYGGTCTSPPGTDKRYSYYSCHKRKTAYDKRTREHSCPHLGAEWIEGLVWTDVRSFLESPGEVLERVREQMGSDAATEELAARREDLARRLAAKQAEKDRYVRAYAQGHISDDELAVYAADLKNQVENLRLLIATVEADLAQKQKSRLAAKSTEAWLMTLRERMVEVEEDTEEAFEKRRQLVKLLVERIDVGRDEYDDTQVHITYRFGPPEASLEANSSDGIQLSTSSAPTKRTQRSPGSCARRRLRRAWAERWASTDLRRRRLDETEGRRGYHAHHPVTPVRRARFLPTHGLRPHGVPFLRRA
jgi:site-specific DNA recombinase